MRMTSAASSKACNLARNLPRPLADPTHSTHHPRIKQSVAEIMLAMARRSDSLMEIQRLREAGERQERDDNG
jgi:hypothetical protein